jgi:tetratricopeptide (TPR) repeat protein
VNAVRERSTDASTLLEFLAYLAPDLILVTFLKAGCDGVEDDLKHVIADDESFDHALFTLEQFSLLKRENSRQGDVLVMHRLVQAFLQDKIPEHVSKDVEIQRQWSNVIGLGHQAFPMPWAHADTTRRDCREFQNQLLPPLLKCPVAKVENILELMGRMGWFLRDEGKLKEAEAIDCKAKLISTKFNGERHPDTLRAMANLASTYRNQGRWDEAVVLEEKVLEVSKEVLGERHPDMLTAMANLASTYWNQGRWDEAVVLDEKVLEVRKEVLGERHPNTLTAMKNLLLMYGAQGRTADAAALQEVLEFRG